jgi:putative transposase
VDVGIRTLATCSNGTCFNNPKALIRKAKKLTHLQRSVSRKVKGSKNREKAKAGVAKCHLQISNIRKDSLHKASKAITKSASTIVIEDLNVAGMVKNHKLARSVNDASFGELHRQIKYKALWAGIPVIIADRWFPSSKMCSNCGFVLKELSLSKREWKCPSCGVSHNRDINAATNLAKLAVSSTVTACGDFSSGTSLRTNAKLLSVKQELNTIWACPKWVSFRERTKTLSVQVIPIGKDAE